MGRQAEPHIVDPLALEPGVLGAKSGFTGITPGCRPEILDENAAMIASYNRGTKLDPRSESAA